MRAKMYVSGLSPTNDDVTTSQTVAFAAIAKREGYPEDGSDENNTFARFTPSAAATFTINNPALVGKFNLGDTFYVDFTPVEGE